MLLFGAVMKRTAEGLALTLTLLVAAVCTPIISLTDASADAFEVTATITLENHGGYYG